jgi:hypothetical protein
VRPMRTASTPCAGWPERRISRRWLPRDTAWRRRSRALGAFGMHPDLLKAEILPGSGGAVILHWLPFEREGYAVLDPNQSVDDSPPRIRGG